MDFFFLLRLLSVIYVYNFSIFIRNGNITDMHTDQMLIYTKNTKQRNFFALGKCKLSHFSKQRIRLFQSMYLE